MTTAVIELGIDLVVWMYAPMFLLFEAMYKCVCIYFVAEVSGLEYFYH